MRGHIKGATSVTNQLYITVVTAYLRMRKFSLIRPLNIMLITHVAVTYLICITEPSGARRLHVL